MKKMLLISAVLSSSLFAASFEDNIKDVGVSIINQTLK